MTPGRALVADLVALAICVCLAGLVARRRLAASPCFVAYLAFVLIANQLIRGWPDTFFRIAFWNWKEAAYGLLKLAILFDIAAVAFGAWPRARRAVRAGLAATAILTLVVPTWVGLRTDSADPMLAAMAWVQVGTGWGFVALLAGAHWYRLPLHSFHRSIVIGFVLYQGVYGTVLDLLRHWPLHPTLLALDPVAYAATALLWAVAAWQPERVSPPSSDRRLLYPLVRS